MTEEVKVEEITAAVEDAVEEIEEEQSTLAEGGEETPRELWAKGETLLLEAQILDGGETDEAQTQLEISMKDLKLGIRAGQFSEEELGAIIKEGVIEQDVVDVLLQHPIELKKAQETPAEEASGKEGTVEEGGPKKTKKVIKKASVTGQIAKKIQELLVSSDTGLTIEEICINLGALAEDADPTDAETKGIKKRYRTFARKAVDTHPDGSRVTNLGRNRLYSIGEVGTRELEEVVEEG